ncbi:hypothetical protein [Arthrobacter sp. StoSoilB20]
MRGARVVRPLHLEFRGSPAWHRFWRPTGGTTVHTYRPGGPCHRLPTEPP